MTLTCLSTCPEPHCTTAAPPSSHRRDLGLSTLCCSWLSASCLVHRFLPTWPQRMSAAISLGFFSPTWFGTTDLRSLLCTCCFSGWRVATVGPPGGCPGVTPGWQLSVVTEPLHPPLASRSGASSQMLGRPSLAVRQAAIASAARSVMRCCDVLVSDLFCFGDGANSGVGGAERGQSEKRSQK